MSSLLAVAHIFGTAASQVAATVGAHGVVAALPHVANIAGATVGWLASGTAGAAVLTGVGAGVAAGAAAVGSGILKAAGVVATVLL